MVFPVCEEGRMAGRKQGSKEPRPPHPKPEKKDYGYVAPKAPIKPAVKPPSK